MHADTTITTDVLVIGGGGAACRAAIATHDAGARVIVALKGSFLASGATVAPGRGVAWQAADECSGPDDSPEVHYRNILDAGLGMADPRLARLVAYEVLERMAELEAWGLHFAPDPQGRKRHFTAYSCFGDQPRAHSIMNSGHGHAGDIVVVLGRQMAQRGIPLHEGMLISDLVVCDGACVGALGLAADGRTVFYRAGAVVLAAGGARQAFPPSGPLIDTTGDGYAMALRAGAELANMEYAQFMLHFVPAGASVQVVGSPWALYPTVRNALGEDALARYLPAGVSAEEALWARTLHAPFSTRDASGWLDVAIASEALAGRGSPEGALWLDFSAVDLARFVPSRPMHLPEDAHRSVVLPEQPLLVRSEAHAINGGVLIDERGASSVPGLYAAGEVAAGPHGADRLGGGMVTNCQVFGARAGRYAAEYARGTGHGELPRDAQQGALGEALARLAPQPRDGEAVEDVLGDLQAATGRHLMVVRDAAGLEALLGAINALEGERLPRAHAQSTAERRRRVEVASSLTVARLMATAALRRTESRGSHFRRDYPARDDARWGASIVLTLRDGELRTDERALGR